MAAKRNMSDVGSPLSADCEATNNILKKFSMPHKDAVQKVFASRPIGARKSVGY